MDILTLIKVILRRWFVVVPIILVTFALAFSVGSSIRPEYGMSGTVLLTSASDGTPADTDSVPIVTAPLLAEILRSAATVKRMTDAGAVVPYVVEVDPSTSILRVTAAGRDGPPNIRTVEIVLENLEKELRLLEETAEVPPRNRAAVRFLSRPSGQPGAGLPFASGSAFLVPLGVGRTNQFAANGYTTRILTELMLAAESRRAVFERAGGVVKFSLSAAQRDAAPILTISVRGADPRLTESAYEAVVATAGDILDDQQGKAGIESSDRTRLVPLNQPAGATETPSTAVKSVATVVGLGSIGAATAAIVVESLMAGRARRRSPSSDRKRRRRKGRGEQPIELLGPDAENPMSLVMSTPGDSTSAGAFDESRSSTFMLRQQTRGEPFAIGDHPVEREPAEAAPAHQPPEVGPYLPSGRPTRLNGRVGASSGEVPTEQRGDQQGPKSTTTGQADDTPTRRRSPRRGKKSLRNEPEDPEGDGTRTPEFFSTDSRDIAIVGAGDDPSEGQEQPPARQPTTPRLGPTQGPEAREHEEPAPGVQLGAAGRRLARGTERARKARAARTASEPAAEPES